jgi:hypothetical protein
MGWQIYCNDGYMRSRMLQVMNRLLATNAAVQMRRYDNLLGNMECAGKQSKNACKRSSSMHDVQHEMGCDDRREIMQHSFS